MSRLTHHQRDPERGTSLVELMVACVLLVAIVPIFGPMMTSALRAGNEVRTHSEVLDELRLQVFAINRELRSAECIYEPAENAPGNRLRFTTNANTSLTYEVTYEVVDGALIRTQGSTERPVGSGIVAAADGTEPFDHIANPRRSVRITLPVQLDERHNPKVVATVVSGRNAWRTC
jgi:hypothetical protein